MIKPEFLDYLHEIELSQPIIERINSVYDKYEPVFQGIIDDIFVEDFIVDGGERQYFSLYLFSKDTMYEIPNFTKKPDSIGIIPLPKKIEFLKMDNCDYNFSTAQINSKLVAIFPLSFVVQSTIKASYKNCNFLMKILNKYITPRLKF